MSGLGSAITSHDACGGLLIFDGGRFCSMTSADVLHRMCFTGCASAVRCILYPVSSNSELINMF